jgi:hypothetical protein
MGRNKDGLIALAEKLTGETCGAVTTKKDALKKIACYYAGQEVKCETIADTIECIAEHCSGGTSGGGGGESGSSNGIYKLICKKSGFFYDTSEYCLQNSNITEYEGGIVYPIHLYNEAVGGINYMYDLAELPEALDGYSINIHKITNNYRGSTVIGLTMKLEKNGIPKQEIEVGLYKIPIYVSKYYGETPPSIKIGELHIEVIDE